MTLSLTFALIGLVVITVVAIREHRRIIAARRPLLDGCAAALSEPKITYGGDGFPTLEGFHGGRYLRAELFPDTMTIRRLPQLWLKLTLIEPRPRLPEFSLLVRPSGYEFYSLTAAHAVVLQPPADIAAEILVKGSSHTSQNSLDRSAPALRRIFSDPRMKEAAVTARGIRLVWQAAEGARGEHLIFRQCRFDSANVDLQTFRSLLAALGDLGSSFDTPDEAQAA
ncbi:MAG: hypothetical protein JSR78_12865 [Proteobacteria bacterium]|nr:hypothetical protein [Pseudomonadota bacterium]